MSSELFLYFAVGILWVLMIGLATSIYRITRSVARLIKLVEGRDSEGVPIKSSAPALSGEILGPVSRGAATHDQLTGVRPTMVFFMGASCPPCRSLRPVVDRLAKHYAGRVTTVITCAGSPESVAEYGATFLKNAVLIADPNRENAQRWEIFMTPFLVIVDEQGLVRHKMARITEDQAALALDAVLASSTANPSLREAAHA